MKIGILTFHSVDNYGAVLQAYALQTYISLLGHDVEIIDYRPEYFEAHRVWSLRPGRAANNIASAICGKKFEDFRRNFMRRTAVCRDKKDLEAKLPVYDVVVVGSDQVWSPDVDRRKVTDPIYFFEWELPAKTKKIAYAASFGTDEIALSEKATIKAGLSRIDAISIRECGGVGIVRELSGRDAKWVPDPVNLISRETWVDFVSQNTKRADFLIAYMVNREFKVRMRGISRIMRKKFVNIGWDAMLVIDRRIKISIPSPTMFVQLLSNACGIVTQSFHAVSFAIIMHTPFVYIMPTGKGVSRANRILQLLDRLGLTSRVISPATPDNDVVLKFCEYIDWDAVDMRRKLFVEEGQQFLAKALST